MTDRRDYRWGPAIAALLLVLTPTLYPISLPAAILLYEAMDEPQWLEPLLETIYEPLMNMPEPFDSALQRWVDLWCP